MTKARVKNLIVMVLLPIVAVVSLAVGITTAWFQQGGNEINHNIGSGGVIQQYFHCGSGSEEDPFVITRPIHYYHLVELYQRVKGFAEGNAITGEPYHFQIGYDKFSGHEGEYLVYDYDDLGAVKRDTNNDEQYSTDLNMGYYAGSLALLPIGTSLVPFIGELDGKGLTVSNLHIVAVEQITETEIYKTSDIGIFGYIGGESKDGKYNGGCVHDVFYEDVTIDISGLESGIDTTADIDETLQHKSHANNEVYIGYIAGHLPVLAFSNGVADTTNIIEDVYINNCNIQGGTYTGDAISEYGLFGHVDILDGTETAPIIDTTIAEVQSTKPSEKESSTGESQSGGHGDEEGAGWGGSLNMLNIYGRLSYFLNQAGSIATTPEYVTEEKVITDKDGTIISREYKTATEDLTYFRLYEDKANFVGSYYFYNELISNWICLSRSVPLHETNVSSFKFTGSMLSAVLFYANGNYIGRDNGDSLTLKSVTDIDDATAFTWDTLDSDEFWDENGSGLYTLNSTNPNDTTKYYLTTDGKNLSLTTEENQKTVWKRKFKSLRIDGQFVKIITDIYTTIGGVDYYIINGSTLFGDANTSWMLVSSEDATVFTDDISYKDEEETSESVPESIDESMIETASESEVESIENAYMNFDGVTLANVNDKDLATRFIWEGKKLYTYKNGTKYYLYTDGTTISLNTTALEWTKTSDSLYTVQNGVTYHLYYDKNGIFGTPLGWIPLANGSTQTINDGNGNYLKFADSTPSNVTKVADATKFMIEGNYITTYIGTSKRYLNTDGTTVWLGDKNSLSWSVGQTSVTTELNNTTYHLIYDKDGIFGTPLGWIPLANGKTQTYNYGKDNYLKFNNDTAISNATSEGEATRFAFENGKLSTYVGTTKYYVYTDGVTLSLSTTNYTLWSKSGNNALISTGAEKYYIIYDNTGIFTSSPAGWIPLAGGTVYKISDSAKSKYMSVSGNSLSSTNSQDTAQSFVMEDTKIMTIIGGVKKYLMQNNTLVALADSTDNTWTISGNDVTIKIGNDTCYLDYDTQVFDGNTGWLVVPNGKAETLVINGQHYLGTNGTTLSDNTQTQTKWAFLNGRLYTVIKKTFYYINDNGNDFLGISQTSSTTWTRSGNTFINGSNYIVYGDELFGSGNGWMCIPNGKAQTIYADNKYLNTTTTALSGGTSSATATRWIFLNSQVYTYISGTRYYLNGTDTTMSISTSSNGNAWSYGTDTSITSQDKTVNKLGVTVGSNIYYIRFDATDNAWETKKYYYLHERKNGYMTNDLGITTDKSQAQIFEIIGDLSGFRIRFRGTNDYITTSPDTLRINFPISKKTTENSNDGEKFVYNTDYAVKSLTNSSGATNRCLCYNYNNNKNWSIRTKTNINSSSRADFTDLQDISNATTMAEVSATTGFTASDYANGTAVSKTATYTIAFDTEKSKSIAFDTAISYADVYSFSVTPEISFDNFKIGECEEIAGLNYNTNLTYMPLLVEHESYTTNNNGNTTPSDDNVYSAAHTNTGYIISGVQDTDQATVIEKGGILGYRIRYRNVYSDIRVSRYDISEINASFGGEDSYVDEKLEVLTITAKSVEKANELTASTGQTVSPVFRIQDYGHNTATTGTLTNYQVMNVNDLGLRGYEDCYYWSLVEQGRVGNVEQGLYARDKLEQMLTGESRIYGLHFMNSIISTDHLVTAMNVRLNDVDYERYQFPESCIDFNVQNKGRVSFFAGTYYTETLSQGRNDSFFSLFEIKRNNKTVNHEITSIRELNKVYKKIGDDNADYVYEYRKYDASNYKYSDNKITDEIIARDYELAFDMDWITNYSNTHPLENDVLYYFEVPCNAGEFALGSCEGKRGAYLIYLDVGANGAGASTGGGPGEEEVPTTVESDIPAPVISDGYIFNDMDIKEEEHIDDVSKTQITPMFFAYTPDGNTMKSGNFNINVVYQGIKSETAREGDAYDIRNREDYDDIKDWCYGVYQIYIKLPESGSLDISVLLCDVGEYIYRNATYTDEETGEEKPFTYIDKETGEEKQLVVQEYPYSYEFWVYNGTEYVAIENDESKYVNAYLGTLRRWSNSFTVYVKDGTPVVEVNK